MNNLINELKILIVQAGQIALKRKAQGLLIEHKIDRSPVTNADIEIDELICNNLKNLMPDANIISEEGVNSIRICDKFWLIDPIDGTKSYIKGDDNYTINIGFIENNIAKIGFIYQPEKKKLYYTDHEGNLKIEQNGVLIDPLILNSNNPYIGVIGSHNYNKEIKTILDKFAIDKISIVPSSLKLCYIAEDAASIYPNISKKMQWDIAAGHALINASGGKILDFNGLDLMYKQDNLEISGFFAYSKRWLEDKGPIIL